MAFSLTESLPTLGAETSGSGLGADFDPVQFERLRRQAEHRLDVLIGRKVGDMALDLHWPTAQLADALGFLETGFAYFERASAANAEADATEVGFFRREVPAALHEAREAMLSLHRMSAGLAVLARDTAASAHIWSPAELMSRCLELTRPLWQARLIIDHTAAGQENARLTASARAILTALTETVLALLRAPPPERTALVLGLYRDGSNILHYRFDLPVAFGTPINLAARTRVAARMLQSVGGTLSVTAGSGGTMLRLDLPEP